MLGCEGADLRVGIDVGGTNTDAVVLDRDNHVLAWSKHPTSPDVVAGMHAALGDVLAELDDPALVGRVMLGTTSATNAIVERRRLGRVAAIRLGAPATTSVPPLESWPADLRDVVCAGRVIVGGGRFVDGRAIGSVDAAAIRRFLEPLRGEIDAVAITGVFSPINPDQEQLAAGVVREVLGDLPLSLSHEIGQLGLLERENATVLNAALHDVAGEVTAALSAVLRNHGLAPTTYFAQNDGTLMALEYAARYPVLTIGSGPANSLRGAALLSGVKSAVVVDVGGTTTDLGVLVDGFPRESTSVTRIGGVTTNFRMPDILSIGLGGGTTITGTAEAPVVGPGSVGHRIREQALAFGGGTATLTDAAIRAGRIKLGTAKELALSKDRRRTDLLAAALSQADAALADALDQLVAGRGGQPVVAVGGGAFLLPDTVPGAGEILRPEHGDIANAVGAAIALASGRWDVIIPAGSGRAAAIDAACATAREHAIQAGADPRSVEIVELIETPLAYLTEPVTRVQIKAAGPLA